MAARSRPSFYPEPGAEPAAGVDEAGRGCLAGPVVAAAVILNPDRPIKGLADSKTLSPSARERLKTLIEANSLAWGLGLSWQKRIDKINILQATFEAMAKAVRSLKIRPSILLIDGPFIIPGRLLDGEARLEQTAVIKGDQTCPCISAASIVAKCFRDKLMTSLARKWPAYGFERHKGYGTKEHLEALKALGSCPLHRMTFKGVRPPSAQPGFLL